ncbi:thymidylate kinase [Mycobacterium ulcerans str. Harvey]|uniref:Thymidylate kinase n=1 Tax=Mycobacterium ulcerans str. Harvey TaxID=1299332 RepID=A0ABP3ADQ3_MYCUL|nr:thymidylate kinase [Mycobacterium ulcerans str. Harvey]
MLIAIEGVDGAGKRTLSEGLRKEFEAAGRSVATLAFPRYGNSVTADIAAEALHGEHGDLASSVFAMATLFALDRAAAVDEIHGLCLAYEVVILDRYVASNAAYSAARLHQDSAGKLWPGWGGWSMSGSGCPNRTGRYCSRCPSSWPARGRVGGPAATRAGPRQLRTRRWAAAAHRLGVRRAGRRGLGWSVAGCRRGRRSGALAATLMSPTAPEGEIEGYLP